MKIRGRVKRSDLEGGVWIFETEDGVTYQLDGGGDDLLVDGVKATVSGSVRHGGFGIGMMGEILVVDGYTIEGN